MNKQRFKVEDRVRVLFDGEHASRDVWYIWTRSNGKPYDYLIKPIPVREQAESSVALPVGDDELCPAHGHAEPLESEATYQLRQEEARERDRELRERFADAISEAARIIAESNKGKIVVAPPHQN